MQIALQVLLLVVGFVMLIKGADWFVDGAAGIADKLRIPQIIIGLTIVAMGTSAPEAAISISASVRGNADIAVGNILGSNILNILIILGVTAIITPLAVQKSTVKYEMPFVIIVSAVFAVMGLTDNIIGIFDGIILLVLFAAYIAYLFIMAKKNRTVENKEDEKASKKGWQLLVLIVVGLALIVIGSDITIDAATELATVFGMSERFIGLTVVAFGTSLPELVTSITAAIKKEADIAIGNIVGSNIFNILFVIGVSAIITPVTYQAEFFVDNLICIAAAVLLLICVLNKDKKLKRWSGIIMLLCYALYFAYLVVKDF